MSIQQFFITDPEKAISNTAAGVVFVLGLIILHNHVFPGNNIYSLLLSLAAALTIGTSIYYMSEYIRKKVN